MNKKAAILGNTVKMGVQQSTLIVLKSYKPENEQVRQKSKSKCQIDST